MAGKALIMTKKFWDRVESKQEGVELDVTLGLIPSINMRLVDPKETMYVNTTLLELVGMRQHLSRRMTNIGQYGMLREACPR